MPVQQGRHGYFEIAGVKYPVYDFAIDPPRNLVAGNPVSNTWSTNFAEGLQTTRITARFMCREKSSEVLALAFWNQFLTRTFASGFDDTSGLTIVASTGRRTRTLVNAKADAFTLTVAKGAVVGLTASYVAPGIPSMADVTPLSYANTFDNSPPLMFDKVTFGGITGGVYGFELTYANNHLPNGPLDGTKFLSEWNSGVITCGCSVTVPEHVAAQEPFADAATLTLALVGGATRNFSLTSVIPNNPRTVSANVGQVFQTYSCLVQGTSATAPLVVT